MPADFVMPGLRSVIHHTHRPDFPCQMADFRNSTTRNNGLLGLSTSISLGFSPALPVMPVHRLDQQTTRDSTAFRQAVEQAIATAVAVVRRTSRSPGFKKTVVTR